MTSPVWQESEEEQKSLLMKVKVESEKVGLKLNIQNWFPLGLTGLISLQSKGLSRPRLKRINTSMLNFLYDSPLTSIHDYWKTRALTMWAFVGKVMSLLFNKLSRLVIDFLTRSKCLLISWLQSPIAVILEPKKINSVTISIVSPSICHEVMGPRCHDFCFLNVEF